MVMQTPMTAEKVWPKKKERGCERGDMGAPKRRTADAPKEPMMAGEVQAPVWTSVESVKAVARVKTIRGLRCARVGRWVS